MSTESFCAACYCQATTVKLNIWNYRHLYYGKICRILKIEQFTHFILDTTYSCLLLPLALEVKLAGSSVLFLAGSILFYNWIVWIAMFFMTVENATEFFNLNKLKLKKDAEKFKILNSVIF